MLTLFSLISVHFKDKEEATEEELRNEESELIEEKEEDLKDMKNELSSHEPAHVAAAEVVEDIQQSITFSTPSKKAEQLQVEERVEEHILISTPTTSATCTNEIVVDNTEINTEDVNQTDTNIDHTIETTTRLSLDIETIENTHLTTVTTPTNTTTPNSLQRHDARVRATSPMRSPLPSSGTKTLHTYTHAQYKKGEDSAWIRNSSVESTIGAASPVSVTPQRHSLPKKIIPVGDDQLPLALRQGTKITECEFFLFIIFTILYSMLYFTILYTMICCDFILYFIYHIYYTIYYILCYILY